MKLLSLRTWRPPHILAAWGTYLAGLAAVTFGPAALEVSRFAGDPARPGTVSAGIDDGVAYLTVVEGATTVWSGTTSLGAMALWVAGPPLLLWLAWLILRPRLGAAGAGIQVSQPADAGSSAAGAKPRELPEPRVDHVAMDARRTRQSEQVRDRTD